MSREEAIRSQLTYMRGPFGQTVVVVPPKLEPLEETSDTCCCSVCAGVFTFLGSCVTVTASIYLIVLLSAGGGYDNPSDAVDTFFLVSIILFVVGVGFIIIAVVFYCFLRDYHKKKITRFMDRSEPEEHQPVLRQEESMVEEVDPEAFARSYEMYNPDVPTGTFPVNQQSSHRRPQRQRHGVLPDRYVHNDDSQRAMHYDPNQMNYSLHQYSRLDQSGSGNTYPLRRPEDRHSPYHTPLANPDMPYFRGASPARDNYRSESPARTHSEVLPIGRINTAVRTPFLASPGGGERSFSPSSDTTYLSNYSSGPEGNSASRA